MSYWCVRNSLRRDSLQGDLVLIPAGCAHQVENRSPLPTVKVAQDFVAAESTARCWEMMQEVGPLGHSYTCVESKTDACTVHLTRMSYLQMKRVKALDVLQLRLTLRFAAAWLYEELVSSNTYYHRTKLRVSDFACFRHVAYRM